MLAGSLFGSPVFAQSALCPTSFSGQPGIAFQGSSCTNNVTGAYSNTALASQSLGELSQSSTQDATRATMASVSDRRTAETQRCADGFTRVNGVCKPGTSASRFAPEAPDSGTLMSMPDSLLAFQPILKAPPPTVPAVEPAARWAVWTQAYGDYERLKGSSPGLGEFSVLGLTATSKTWTGGVLGGGDFTFRNLATSGDGLIVGVLGGYESSHMSLSTSSISSDPTSPNGFSTLKAQLSGPTTGVYASYFNGGFSTDLAFKVEFFDVGISFNDLLGFQSNPDVGFPPTSVPFSGSGSTSLNNYTTSGNVNYRIPVAANLWIEPTAGFQYTRSDYASGADQLGLASGSDLRLQGGSRFGVEGAWNAVRVTTVFTGLVYDNVAVSGGVLQNSPNPQILSDEGKLNVEGIAALNFYHGNGVTSFVQADILGGPGLFGAGGKTGLRVAW
jgi:hypothetical protein